MANQKIAPVTTLEKCLNVLAGDPVLESEFRANPYLVIGSVIFIAKIKGIIPPVLQRSMADDLLIAIAPAEKSGPALDCFASLESIASLILGFDTLETRNSDDLDFREASVWCVRAALEAAYNLGKNAK